VFGLGGGRGGLVGAAFSSCRRQFAGALPLASSILTNFSPAHSTPSHPPSLQAVEPLIKHPSHFVALLLEGAALPHPGYGHVVLADPSPVLFYPISSTEVRCLVDYPGGGALPAAEELKKYLLATVAPQVPPALRAPFEAAVAAGRVRSMQNKQLTAAPVHAPGALLLGDAFNMRHPLTGGGMTVALSDTRLLAEMLRPVPALADALRASDATAAFYVRRKPLAATINTLANALYDVFCAADSKTSYAGAAHEEMRQACFDYLRMGGAFSAGPVSLLSGLNPRPSLLVAHFFMVALYGVGRLLLPRPSVRGVFLGVGLLVTAARIILPIIWAEGPRAVFAPALAARAPRGRARAAAEGAAAAAAAATAAAAAAAG
jgi:squalene monooxygenase